MQDQTYYNPIVTLFASIVSTTNNKQFVTFLLSGGNSVRFSQLATNPPRVEIKATGTESGKPETFINQIGSPTLRIIYNNPTDQTSHFNAFRVLFDTAVTVTLDSGSQVEITPTTRAIDIQEKTIAGNYSCTGFMFVQLIALTGTFSIGGRTIPFTDASGNVCSEFSYSSAGIFVINQLDYTLDASSSLLQVLVF